MTRISLPLAFTLIITLLVSTRATAGIGAIQPDSASDLYEACKIYKSMEDIDSEKLAEKMSEFDVLRVGACKNYIWGFASATVGINQIGKQNVICIPKEANLDHAVEAFMRWYERNPLANKERLFVGVAKALQEKFPCK